MSNKKITLKEAKEALTDPQKVVMEPEDQKAPRWESLQEKIRSGEIDVRPAPQDRTEILSNQVDQVLEALGFETAWVSDMSSVWDFGLEDEEIVAASEKLDVEISKNDLIVDIAQRLADR